MSRLKVALIDPALFTRIPSNKVSQRVDFIIDLCRNNHIKLPPVSEYWDKLWSELVHPLQKSLNSQDKLSLTALRNFAKKSTIHFNKSSQVNWQVWQRGFEQLFSANTLNTKVSWEEAMIRAVLQVLNSGYEAIILTQNIAGRNLKQHQNEHITLDEITRWVLYVQPEGIEPQQIPCIYHARNLQEKWTIRFDYRLPATSDGGKYPFCPPDKWWLGKIKSHETIESKPGWIDRFGNGWVRPNTPGNSYHWDVFVIDALQQKLGLSQINVAQFDLPPQQGTTGNIHHIPTKKQSRFNDIGWKCDEN